MQKLFRSILSPGRNLRIRAVSAALWLLRLVRDVEKDDMCRHESTLEKLGLEPDSDSKREYAAIEDDCLDCEHALASLEHVIDELELEYRAVRF